MCLEKPLSLVDKLRKAMLQSQNGCDSFGPTYDEEMLAGKVEAILNERRAHAGETPVLNVPMTHEQAVAVSKALDVHTRLGLGQLEIVGELVRKGAIPLRVESKNPRQVADYDDINSFDKVMTAAKAVLGYSRIGSNGIGHSHVAIEFLRGNEVKKVIDTVCANFRSTVQNLSSADNNVPNLRATQN